MPATYCEVCTPAPIFSHLFCISKNFCLIFDGYILNICKAGANVQQVTKNQASITADPASCKPAHTHECQASALEKGVFNLLQME